MSPQERGLGFPAQKAKVVKDTRRGGLACSRTIFLAIVRSLHLLNLHGTRIGIAIIPPIIPQVIGVAPRFELHAATSTSIDGPGRQRCFQVVVSVMALRLGLISLSDSISSRNFSQA